MPPASRRRTLGFLAEAARPAATELPAGPPVETKRLALCRSIIDSVVVLSHCGGDEGGNKCTSYDNKVIC